MSRPIPWMSPGVHAVDSLMNIGLQAIGAGLSHVAADWGSGPVDPDVFAEISPNFYFWHAQSHTCTHLDPKLLTAPWFALLDPSARPLPFMRRARLLEWWQATILAGMAPQKFAELMGKPDFLIFAGVHLLKKIYSQHSEDTPEVGACLAMVGTGAAVLFGSDSCTICRFRRAVHATGRCSFCTRSKWAASEVSGESKDARSHRNRRIQATSSEISVNLGNDIANSCARSVASILFHMGTDSAVYKHWYMQIHEVLTQSPTVTARLPKEFDSLPPHSQLQALRKAVDPWEWDYSLWPEKIEKAQAWFDASEKLQQRRLGSGPTLKSIALAEEALSLLNTTQTRREVAERLGISSSHLSHLLKRTASTPWGPRSLTALQSIQNATEQPMLSIKAHSQK